MQMLLKLRRIKATAIWIGCLFFLKHFSTQHFNMLFLQHTNVDKNRIASGPIAAIYFSAMTPNTPMLLPRQKGSTT